MSIPRKPSGRSPGARPQTQRGSTKGHKPGTSRPPRGSAAARTARTAPAAQKQNSGAPATPPPRPLGPAPVLTTRQRCYLRGLGHHLEPVVLIGKEGVTEPLCSAVADALVRHELIKLRLAETVDGDRHELAAELAARCHAALVQVLGRTLLLYRRRPSDKPGRDARSHLPLP